VKRAQKSVEGSKKCIGLKKVKRAQKSVEGSKKCIGLKKVSEVYNV